MWIIKGRTMGGGGENGIQSSLQVGRAIPTHASLTRMRCQVVALWGVVRKVCMMTSSNGNIFRVTGHLRGEFTGYRWILRTKASGAELWCFLNKRLSKQSWSWWFETPSRSLWRHCYVNRHRNSKRPQCVSVLISITIISVISFIPLYSSLSYIFSWTYSVCLILLLCTKLPCNIFNRFSGWHFISNCISSSFGQFGPA